MTLYTALSSLTRVAAVACLAANGISAGIVTYAAGGADAASITPTRDAFRTAVGGGAVAAANGDFGGVRREINWDGVPAGASDPNLMPGDFFNTTSPRGAVFTTPGTGFLVSAAPGGATSALFGFPADLQTFSPAKLFATIGSNIMDVRFFLPGTTTAATTSAFAAIFVDVETADSTLMEFFDESNTVIFSQFATVTGNQGLSFLGGVADAGERIARVRITMPANFLISNGVRANETVDFVVMDDFLYATPIATGVPEPSSLGFLALGGLLTAAFRRKR